MARGVQTDGQNRGLMAYNCSILYSPGRLKLEHSSKLTKFLT